MADPDEPTKDEAADQPVQDADSADADDQPGEDSPTADDGDPDQPAGSPDEMSDDTSSATGPAGDRTAESIGADADDEDPFSLDDDFDSQFGEYDDDDEQNDDDGLRGVAGGLPGYAELTRGEPGMDTSRWIVVGVVVVAFILLSFILIPKLFDSDDKAASKSSAVPSSAATSSAPPQKKYGDTILEMSPKHYWRFTSAGPVLDELGTSNLTFGKDAFPLGSSAVKDNVGAIDCNGSPRSSINSQTPEAGTGDFSVVAWINTQASTGGQIVSFGDQAEGSSDTVTRSLYLDGTGYAHIGIRAGKRYHAVSEKTYADGAWHQIVGTYSATGGLTLYVDGAQVGAEPAGVGAKDLTEGFWRICGDNLASWPGASGGPYFLGSVDEVAVYGNVLTAEQIQAAFGAAQVG